MKIIRNQSVAFYLLCLLILSFALVGSAIGQSTDIDSPTPLYANVVDGEGDGKGETIYYYFTATKGDVKVTVDGKTNNYSTPLRVSLLDEDGKELLPVYVVANDTGKREVATKRFVREQKILLKISTQDDKDVKLLTYKIKLDGAVKFETPPATPGELSVSQPATPTEPAAAEPATAGEQTTSSKPKGQVKTKAKTAAKAALKSIIDR